jgi:hypothetical protein
VGAVLEDTLACADDCVEELIEVTDAVAGPGVLTDAHAETADAAAAIASASAAPRNHLHLESGTTTPPC